MTVCGLAAGAGAHYLPDDARSRVPGMGRDRTEASKKRHFTQSAAICVNLKTHWLLLHDTTMITVRAVDPSGHDAGDRLRSRWHGVTGGVDPGRHDHHPAAGPAGPGDGESTERGYLHLLVMQVGALTLP